MPDVPTSFHHVKTISLSLYIPLTCLRHFGFVSFTA